MKSLCLSLLLTILITPSRSQNITAGLTKAFTRFEKDTQLKNAVVSLYVIDAITGKVVFDKNSRVGLAPASTQKIIIAAAAYDLLGKDFTYKTTIGYTGELISGSLSGNICIIPSGDPTLGSWRWKSTAEDNVMHRITTAIQNAGIKTFGSFLLDARGWESETIPGGWIWEDIGNYYGAGADILNWRENQYDLLMKSGDSVGAPVTITGTRPALYNYDLLSAVTTGAKGSGDNAYIYFPITSSHGIVRGTIPPGEKNFVISGAMPSARNQFLVTLTDSLSKKGITKQFTDIIADRYSKVTPPADLHIFHQEISPPLDSIIFWFLKRSINLYGEALIKTIAAHNNKTASALEGAHFITAYWSGKKIGIDATELNIKDGSGLSPLNRITTHAQVTVLQYAKRQPWFAGYFNSFPEFNGMKVKSGTINDAKGFCGYHTSKGGRQYIFSFLVNNYNGPSSGLVQKMFAVMDVLK